MKNEENVFNCTSKGCKGDRKCSAHSEQCYQCGRNGHFKDFEYVEEGRLETPGDKLTKAQHMSHIQTPTPNLIEQGAKRLTIKNAKLTSDPTRRHIYGTCSVGVH